MEQKVSVYLALSLDGYIAAPDGDVSWLDPFHDPEDDFGWADFFGSIDALLMGRKTWDVVQQFPWPYGDKSVYVRTRRELPARNGEQAVSGAIAEILSDLAGRGHQHVYVDGGVTVQDALAAGLVDEVTLSTIPVVLGDGIPLFQKGWGPHRWTLARTRGSRIGLVQSTYIPQPPA